MPHWTDIMLRLTIPAFSFCALLTQVVGATTAAGNGDSFMLPYHNLLSVRCGDAAPMSSRPFALSFTAALDEWPLFDWTAFDSVFETGDAGAFEDEVIDFRPIEHFASGASRSFWSRIPLEYANVDRYLRPYGFGRLDQPTGSMPISLVLAPQASLPLDNDWQSTSPSAGDPIQPILTVLSGVDAAKALRRAWKKAQSKAPSLELLVLLTAHWAHETAAGASMYNYNFGGLKGRGPDGLSCLRGAREGFGFRTHVIRARFRAYPDAASGAADYVSLLLRKYPMAIDAAERGDALEFVRALHDGRYFTGSEETYSLSMLKYTPRARTWAFEALGIARPVQELLTVAPTGEPAPSLEGAAAPPALEQEPEHAQ